MCPDTNPNPGFTQPGGAEISENRRDETGILTDQDQTALGDALTKDENMGAISNSLESLEDEPADFMRGEVDVVEQMDRAASAMDASIRGLPSQADEDSPRSEIGASFKDTPGGLEEVEMKTDEDMAKRHHPNRDPDHKVDHRAERENQPGHRENPRGHSTGGYTDIGAGRSWVTRSPDRQKH
ncbi:MAG: hypothetical protein ACAH59_00025 [Pseudobdellovibrionaceae bacterium]